MARQLRVEYEGAIYHITVRSNGQDELFVDDPDRVYLLGRLRESAEQHGVRVYLFCLMLVKYANLTQREAAGRLGLATGAGVSYQIRNLYRQMEGLPEIRQQHAKATKNLKALRKRE